VAITDALTRSYGPLPGWAWAGVVGAGIWLLLPRLRGASGTSTSGATATPGPDATYGLGYAQGLQAAGPSSSGATPIGTPTTPTWQFGPGWQNLGSGRWIWRVTPTFRQQYPQFGAQSFPGSSSPPEIAFPNAPQYGWQWAAVPEGETDVAYAQQLNANPASAGVGGPGAMGSRSASLMSPWHPLVSAHHRYPHFVRAVGGAPNHTSEVARVAQQAGVHPARLMMLNPNPNGWVRVA